MSMSLDAACFPCRVYTYIGKDYRHFGYGGNSTEDHKAILAFLNAHATHGNLQIFLAFDAPDEDWVEWIWDDADNKTNFPVRHLDPRTNTRWQHGGADFCTTCNVNGYEEEMKDPSQSSGSV